MANSGAGAGGFSGNFMFVGSVANDAKSGKKIRSHLMREYYRKERWKKCKDHRQQQSPSSGELKPKDPDSPDEWPTAEDAKKPRGSASPSPSSSRVTKKSRKTVDPVGSVPQTILSPVQSSSTRQSSRGLPSPPSSSPSSQNVVVFPSMTSLPLRQLTPEALPEPLFCPPMPKRSDDLSTASEVAFSIYTPAESLVARIHEESDDQSGSKSPVRVAKKSFRDDIYVRRPALCGSGSEIFVSPFGYLPIKLNTTDHSVLQYYTRLPELVYNVNSNNRYCVHKTVFLPISFLYPETLYMCLASSHNHLTQRYNISDRSLTLFYKQKADERIQKSLDKAESRYSEAVVAGLLGNSTLTLGANPSQADFVQFMRCNFALSHVIRMRGGLQSFKNNVRLQLGYCAIVLLIGKAWSDCLGRFIPRGFEEYARLDMQDFRRTASQLTSWLRQSSGWARALVDSNSVAYATSPKQADIFRRYGAVYKVLDWPQVMVDGEPKRIMYERTHHTFALIYLALAMWEFRDDPPENKETFLRFFSEGLQDNDDISRGYTSIALVWMLLEVYIHEPERAVSTLTLAKVVWRLSLDNFILLKNFLLWLICPTETEPPPMSNKIIELIEMDATKDLPDI